MDFLFIAGLHICPRKSPEYLFASASDTICQNFAGECPFQTSAGNIEGWTIDAAMLHQACKDTMRCRMLLSHTPSFSSFRIYGSNILEVSLTITYNYNIALPVPGLYTVAVAVCRKYIEDILSCSGQVHT